MKIGILTYHWASNFGANLQALSTYNYLKNAGYNPVIINWIPSKIEAYVDINSPQYKEHKNFVDTYFMKTIICRNNKEIAKNINSENIEKVLIGSDAVFSYLPLFERLIFPQKYGVQYIRYIRPLQDRTVESPYWGGFVDYCNVDVSVISGSAQNCNYHRLCRIEKQLLRKKINNFSNIFVRDVWTKNMIFELTNNKVNPKITPDPVFAFNQNAREPYMTKTDICKKYGLKEKYILFSVHSKVFSNEWLTDFGKLCFERNIELIELPRSTMDYASILDKKIPKPLPVIDWYYLIKYSCGYIGELMHPIIVSLHNSIPFYSIDTYGYVDKNGEFDESSSKIYQILKRFKLLEYYYHKQYSKRIPTPFEVMNLFEIFDEISCSKISDELYDEYAKMMESSLQ